MIIICVINVFMYFFDKRITPNIFKVANAQAKVDITEIINRAIIKECSKNFNYHEIIKIDKDHEGKIVLLRADTLKMNKIACDITLDSQKQLEKLQNMGLYFPAGYIFKNNIMAYYGPKIKVKVEPIGYIETKYKSTFESAGINQTRHTIYVEVKTKANIILPFKNDAIEVNNEVPICETIIVGNTPDSAIDMNLDGLGFKVKNNK
ncbi:sporulation protein YunB [Clostridium niameyense]|uniref:Sporulation protein YunB n=2 Tax=Clostridium niameyense TaxID=1622073 RepID=A0A6M0R7D9_9CLOT|nr:sporulation protein YunB [Clostridium niameyense]